MNSKSTIYCNTCQKQLLLERIDPVHDPGEYRLVNGYYRCSDNKAFCNDHIDAAITKRER